MNFFFFTFFFARIFFLGIFPCMNFFLVFSPPPPITFLMVPPLSARRLGRGFLGVFSFSAIEKPCRLFVWYQQSCIMPKNRANRPLSRQLCNQRVSCYLLSCNWLNRLKLLTGVKKAVSPFPPPQLRRPKSLALHNNKTANCAG